MSTSTEAKEQLERPIWFGPEATALFGWLTVPSDGTARGGVLLAPPIGREARAARRALRRMARALAAAGFVSLRFDYAGTGDSVGSLEDPDLDRAWIDSVASGVELLRSCELPAVSAVGMRLGATILGGAADAHDLRLSSLVLWDPCESGRNYLRELGALEALRRDHVDVDSDGSVETAEFVFPARTASELRRLRLTPIERRPLAERLLVVARPDRVFSEKLRGRLDEEHVEWETASDQGAMLDVDPLHAALPEETSAKIVGWLSSMPHARTAFKDPKEVRDAIVVQGESSPVAERGARLGPNRLFGIVSEPVGPSTGPLVVFLNVSNEEHTGPSRLWVELARRWAASGMQCLRFDLTGLGDSPWAPGDREPAMYDNRWLADMRDAARTLRPDDPSDTVFVGLCSGAYLAVEAGLSLRARGVCAINPPVGIDFLYGTSRLAGAQSAPARALGDQLKEVALRLRWVSVVVGLVLRVIMPSMFGVDAMSTVATNGTDLFVLASTDDLSPTSRTRRFDRFFSRRLVAPRDYHVTFVPGLDHSMHAAVGRRRAIAMLDDHVLECFAHRGPPGTDPADDKEQG